MNSKVAAPAGRCNELNADDFSKAFHPQRCFGFQRRPHFDVRQGLGRYKVKGSHLMNPLAKNNIITLIVFNPESANIFGRPGTAPKTGRDSNALDPAQGSASKTAAARSKHPVS